MLPMERLNNIKKLMLEHHQMDVASLSHTLDVTEATIRRDLEKLENENFLTRTHGGAVLNETTPTFSSLFAIDEVDLELYKPISQVASTFVKDNDVIFLGPGQSSRFIARELSEKVNVSAVTTDIMVAHDLAQFSPNISIILTGGNLNPTTLQLSGRISDNTLKTFYFDLAFFDIDGLTIERGYSVSSLDKAYLTKDIVSTSKRSFAICPYTHIGTDSANTVGNIKMFPSIITNEHAPNKFKEYFFENNIQMFATFDAFQN